MQKSFTLFLLSFLFFLAAQTANAESNSAQKEFVTRVSALEKQHGGRLGVAVVLLNGKPLLARRENERFAMCSTFKALLGAAVLARVDAQRESLGRAISYKESDLLEYAPITKENLSAGSMTIAELNEASIQYSDNTAANLLLESIGGPAALTDFMRSLGDKTTRLDRNEPTLNTNMKDDERDTSTPAAMASSLQKLLSEDVLSLTSKEQFKAWLFGNTTGANRLKAGFDKNWLIGDKTGTGSNGAANDVAIVYPRGLPPFTIAVFYTDSNVASEIKNTVIAEVARIASEILVKYRSELKLPKMDTALRNSK
ncbi:class A beta-lactamase [Undibacterium sp. Di24W]|uniref:class A beta-lactamase n=1 Tax=Undibacterium sp. Di24W TaxID=3413033 RepID=UPI003BF420A6